MHKTTAHIPQTSSPSVEPWLETVMAKMRASLDKLIPVGYQDESGFHAGVKKDGAGDQWPPFN